jgi:UDPglucose--hexose-1-phosphate uridylyltransferase
MSEIRLDPTSEEWVIMASERGKRPSDFIRPKVKAKPPDFLPSCPFCPGNEAKTPKEILSYQDQNKGSWQIRVFANKFPALALGGSTERRQEMGSFLSIDGVGVHEVIVETPVHNRCMALMDESEIANILLTYQNRYDALRRIPLVRQIIIFKNQGANAGTSIEHPHSQLVASPVVPRHFRIQHEVATNYYDRTGRCLYSDLLYDELTSGRRVLMETDRFAAFHPFASRQPFETWILPKAQQASFSDTSTEDRVDLARVIRIILLKLYRGLNNPAFNLIVKTAPVGDESHDYYLWHVRIIPRIIERAGFEIGSGISINVALPEETAQLMRELEVE